MTVDPHPAAELVDERLVAAALLADPAWLRAELVRLCGIDTVGPLGVVPCAGLVDETRL